MNSILYNLDLEQLFVKCCPEGQFAKFVQNTFNKQVFRNDNFQRKVFGNNNLHTKKASWMTICQIWKKKNYTQQQFEKRCLKQFTNFATGYDPQHNRNFPKWLVNKKNATFVLFTLSGCSNPREVKIFGLLPTSSYQPYTIATFKATSRLLIYIKTIKNLKQSAKYVHDGVPDIFWHSGLNPN